MNDHMPIYVGEHAVENFVDFCRKSQYSRFYLIADENTFPILGERVLRALKEQGWDVLCQILNPDHLHTDDFSITKVLATYDAQPRLFVAVGSGTITDITRFTSHRSQNSFVSFPTAGSVDAFTSRSAPATISGLKGSIYCQSAIAIFTDLPTICNAPRFLTASGFGDSISKFASASDWKYTHLIWGLPFDEDIYRHALHAARQSAGEVEGIASAEPDSMAKLMDSQFESGFCMADFINTSPASGAEHHIAHIWEMMFQWEGREGLYHGQAVGVTTIIVAEWYRRFRRLTKDEAEKLLDKAQIPAAEEQKALLREKLPRIADGLIESNPIYIQLSDPVVFAKTKGRILDQWDVIQDIAANVPPPEQIRDWLKMVGGPTTMDELGVTPLQQEIGMEFSIYLRERFSMNIIRKLLGW